ncbi:DNA cytosine methyltransferase [Lactococcus garvieae]|uniref:DNA cytosine methyltransferase n=1 Tax=Lactococcus garvieae TaxID=1363 RepID=UPI0030B9D0DB
MEEKTYFDNTPIEKINPQKLSEMLPISKKELDVMFGGVVCKGFSLAGERSPNDERNTLYRSQLNLVKEFLPKISIVENVPGIINAEILNPLAPQDIKDEIDDIWRRLEQYKGRKASLRKNNLITEEFEKEGIKLRNEKSSMMKKLKVKAI